MKTNCTILRRRSWERTLSPFALGILASLLWLASGQALPVIVTQPADVTVCEGEDAPFCIVAESQLPLTYQWRWHMSTLSHTNIPFGTQDCITLAQQPAFNGSRRVSVVVTDSSGSVTSRQAVITVPFRARITQTPVETTILEAEPATLAATVTGSAPLTYQWYFNDQAIPRATNTSLPFAGVQAADDGYYHVAVSNVCRVTRSDPVRLRVVKHATFTRITTGPIVTDLGSCGWGAHVGDYDADGYLDVFAPRYIAQPSRSALYHNNRDGTFTRVASNALPFQSSDTGGVWADFDNDGRSDLLVFNYLSVGDANAGYFAFPTTDGLFTKVAFGLQGLIGNRGVGIADFDQDGRLDLLELRALSSENRVYRNLDGRQFQPVSSSELGDLTKPGQVVLGSASLVDYDDDGAIDVFAASDFYFGPDSPCRLYHNDGRGRFTSVTNQITMDAVPSRFAAWGDYDNDGRVDLFIAWNNWSLGFTNFIYRNLGGGRFERTSARVDPNPDLWTGVWGDYDNDGFLDLLVGYRGVASVRHPDLYWNNGNGGFIRITVGAVPTTAAAASHSLVGNWFDYDNDGFLDLLVSNGERWEGGGLNAANFLYHNNGNSNAWLKVKLVGTRSNRDAVGAKVRVKATFAGATRWQRRDISAGDQGCGNNNPIAHFGLRDASVVDTLRVEWPSGQVTELHDVAVRQHLTVTEPLALRAVGMQQGTMQLQLTAHPGMNVGMEVSSNLLDWVPWQTVPQTNRITPVTDPDAGQHLHRFYKARVQ